ncbi:MAG: 16S rRNA (cytidine(1402)-2'-O)-methyltransferase [Pseudomonadales bacterium]|nr:16S rRNA (cytidine(1402)-2'-O)-methyltransferase [Pseudomonadales bacterium]
MGMAGHHTSRECTPPAGTPKLYIVATPIGNLQDITQRAVDVLKSVATVACEDTRRSRKLLSHLGAAPKRLMALHDHNEASATSAVLACLHAGEDVALIADAGTPLISDPGFELVRRAWQAGIAVIPVPGASAVAAAVAISPVAVSRFHFEGFLPARTAARREVLARLLASDVAVVFFEAPHRLRDTLEDLKDLNGGGRRVLICRELTKLHETITFGTIDELLAADTVLDRGEFVCILSPEPEATPHDEGQAIVDVLSAELPAAQAARLASKITGLPRRRLYARAVSKRRPTE